MELKYKDLVDIWLKAHETNSPLQMTIKKDPTVPTYWLSADDLQVLQNAFTPANLYLNPQTKPLQSYDYASPATTMFPVEDPIATRPMTLLASSDPKSFSSFYGVPSEANELLNPLSPMMQSLMAQGIYEHELGHVYDPRLRPRANNKGYLTRYGMGSSLGAQEAPAIERESAFWKALGLKGTPE